MVLPLFDDNSDRRITPYVNYALIAANMDWSPSVYKQAHTMKKYLKQVPTATSPSTGSFQSPSTRSHSCTEAPSGK